ncbi:MAG: hypothetical protein CVU38_05295 [Chloroflexi bacterium HGW-Chloroflexi-1]|nr:MAG: hypothetical protein CVU38_05295 [Chloroflexi bacterium HGW-Chloroflexi-1]
MSLSITQCVARVLEEADRPCTLTEILARVAMLRPVDTVKPQATIRGVLSSLPLAVSLGGRPAHYVWWPHALANNVFRQPLDGLDLSSGQLPLCEEVWLALWPTCFVDRTPRPHEVTLVLPGDLSLQAQIDSMPPRSGSWGILPNPALVTWFQDRGVATGDALRVRVLDVPARRYAVELIRAQARDEPVIAARNRVLADAIAEVLRASRDDLPDFYLIPRLVARGAYRDPLPPDPLDVVLAGDLGFIVGKYSIRLAEKMVDQLERETSAMPVFEGFPRPSGNRRQAHTEDERRAWAAYLFDRGMDYRRAGWQLEAEAYYREALQLDPGHADAWVHLGNIRSDEGQETGPSMNRLTGTRGALERALACYERGEAAGLARTIGDPATYTAPFWLDLDSRPYMRALHGKGCCLWQLGRIIEAREVFAHMLRLNPDDNQGARFLLYGLDQGLSWEEEVAREDREWGQAAR